MFRLQRHRSSKSGEKIDFRFSKFQASQADKKPHDQIEPGEAINLGERIHMLEIELAEALETNNMYKQQLKSFLSEKQVADDDAHERPSAEVVQMDGHRRRTSSLEAELKDLRERYFNMSIKYAQVEAEREELVMKLKTPKKERRWFS
ncbi:hypothetical protein QJS10_CPB21g00287 [Acorus calamus]|uniref:Uncharacterized protein n=1 Tax=Acorus calamus TaxID=4465 RepID=A0AAV9C609_ACOCL|nr:hypothetical protein QJS10_CPB21g00287 [Acorus calamus]